jgi:hypothetical protein
MPEPIRPVPAEPWSDEPAVIIDGYHGTPPIRELDAWTRDVTPPARLLEPRAPASSERPGVPPGRPRAHTRAER